MTFSKIATAGIWFFLQCSQVPVQAEEKYFSEQHPFYPENPWTQVFKIDEMIYEGSTPFQKVSVFKNSLFGTVLALDNVIQATELDEFVYHEMLAQLPLLAHGCPKNVLIIGGGDGGSLREVLRHKSVESVTMVELDPEVVDLCKQYMPSLSNGAFDDSRAHVVIQDGCVFVKETDQKFDVIICDTTDSFGPGEVLFTSEFYADCKRILNKGGILTSQNSVPLNDGRIVARSFGNLSKNFDNVRFYVAPIPTYIGGFMVFALSTDNADYYQLNTDLLKARMDAVGPMKYYTPQIHNAAFTLPKIILNMITK